MSLRWTFLLILIELRGRCHRPKKGYFGSVGFLLQSNKIHDITDFIGTKKTQSFFLLLPQILRKKGFAMAFDLATSNAGNKKARGLKNAGFWQRNIRGITTKNETKGRQLCYIGKKEMHFWDLERRWEKNLEDVNTMLRWEG